MTTDRATVRSLTRGQKAILIGATLPMIAVGIGGAIGTYANATNALHRSATAIGVVAAGEGATLVAALVMVGVTMLGQAAPLLVRAALWILPAAAATMGLAIAPTLREAVIYALTPMAMTAAAEGSSFLARRIFTHTSGTDVEAQRRNADLMRQIAYHSAQADRHPDPKVRKKSALEAWKLMKRIGDGDAQLGSGLIAVQRERLTEGADTALAAMLAGTTAHPAALESSREPITESSREPIREPELEPASPSPLATPRTTTASEPHPSILHNDPAAIHPADQHVSREPVLIPSEPLTARTATASHEPARETASEPTQPEPVEPSQSEPTGDDKEQQVSTLAHRLRTGERLTKSSAAQILGVSPATAGRRLKDARDRIGEGTGFYN